MSRSKRTTRNTRRHTFKQTKLACAVSTALASTLLGGNALAQDQGPIEEVVVSGIRGSLERSMDMKRDAVGVVDAINAEDIGKFPDSNLAESLQRITGVSIDRRNGEGNQITVRGFGPSFNLVLLNGRQMPTSALTLSKTGGSDADTSRSFDMSNLAAEGVSAVEVYKSSRADLPTGGIGATVNLSTRRPFDTEGFSATVGAKALHDTTVRVGDEITPELSAFVSWSDDVWGVSLAYTKQERHSAQSGVFSNNWSAQSGPWDPADPNINSIPFDPGTVDIDDDGTPAGNEPLRRIDGQFAPAITADDLNVINAPAPGQLTQLTDGIRYYHEDHERTRENAQATLQFRPMENLTATLDYTKAEQEIFLNGAEFSFWFGGGTFPATDVQFDDHSQVRTSEYIWLENPTGAVRDLGVTQNQGHVVNELESVGFNVEWELSDTLSLEFDMHSSEASSLPPNDDTIGTYFNIATGAQGVWAFGYDNSGDLPLLVGVYGDDNRGEPAPMPGQVNPNPNQGVVTSTGDISGELDVGDLGSTVRQGWYARALSEIDQFQVSGTWEVSDALSVDFGVDSRSMEANQRVSSLTQVLEGNWGVGTPGDVPPGMMEELDFADLFEGYNTGFTPDSLAFFESAGLDSNPHFAGNSGAQAEVFTKGWIAKDVKELGKLLSSNAGLDWAPEPSDGTNRTIEEDITAFYIQGSYEMELAGMPLDAVLGVRYEDTEVNTRAQIAPREIVWMGDNDLVTNAVGSTEDAVPSVGTAEYDHTLPSLALSLGITDDLIARFAYSQTISRPSYGQMQVGINGVQPPAGGPTALGAAPGTAGNGDAGLLPLESDNIDLSLEWYYGDASYVSIGYFKKDVENFIGTEVAELPVLDTAGQPATLDPTNGPRVQAAIAQLAADGIALNQQNLFAMVASLSTEGDGCTTSFGTGENASNSASCGAAFADYAYETANGWEDNVDITATAGDPTYIARVGFPVNRESAKLDGWELAVQHFFGDSGFGVQANYTMVDSDDIAFDITASPTETQFALLGLSDSANLVLIYEQNDWSARLAYNWRDDFLYTTTSSAREPGHTEEYSQLDLNVGYNITDNFSVSFEAINLTGEDQRTYARTKRQLIQLGILDTRYALGARYEF